MSEPYAAFLKLKIERPAVIGWLDAAPAPSSRWDDWRDIGGNWTAFDWTKVPLYRIEDCEQPLTAAIKGTSGFAEQFSAQGPADRRGRSLRQLDLEHRLLRYPCSYMIYSAAFRALPANVRAAIYGRMRDILSGRDASPKYARLAAADRHAVLEILHDTLSDLPAGFE